MRNLALATASVIALTAGSAQAASYTEAVFDPFDFTSLSATELDANLSVPQFDTSLGNLTAVDWTVTTLIDTTLTLTNNSTTDQNTGSGSTDVEYTLTGLSPSVWGLDIADGTGTPGKVVFDTSAMTGEVTLDPEASDSFDLDASETITGGLPTPDLIGVLDDWEGAGIIGFDYETLTSVTITGGGGNFVGGQDTTAGINLEVTYTYETAPIPVPAALPLMASALGVFGVMRYRKRR